MRISFRREKVRIKTVQSPTIGVDIDKIVILQVGL